MVKFRRSNVVALIAIAALSMNSAASELRIGTSSACPQTGKASEGEFALGALLLPLAGAVVEKATSAVLQQAASYLKDDTNVTKTGYARGDRTLTIDPSDKEKRYLNASLACVYGVVGDFGNEVGRASNPAVRVISTDTVQRWNEMRLQGEPLVYFEGIFLFPSKNSSAKNVIYFQPRFLYYGEHIKSGGLFGSGKRDLGISIELSKAGDASPWATAVVPVEAIKPSKAAVLDPGFFASRQSPWIALPSLDKDGPANVKMTIIETGKPDVLDKALGEALAEKKGDIATAIRDAIIPKPDPKPATK